MRAVCTRRRGGKTPKWVEEQAKSYNKRRHKRYKEHRSTFYDYAERKPVRFVMEDGKNG